MFGEHKKYLVDKDLFALIYLYYLTTGWKMRGCSNNEINFNSFN
uniref:Uncharacterized protein n=1 Tax=Meloidogyne enterolobii TaxID=390850 RepID=A0A6V7X9J9_MELEN|nr:unnamed protein product [Meloidogyne enterolobii]